MFKSLSLICLLVTGTLGGVAPRYDLLEGFHGRIIGGTEASRGEFPSQGSQMLSNFHNCGASIIGDKWAVTAAHCLEGQSASVVSILAGTTNWYNPDAESTKHKASRIIIHEEYDPDNSWIHDIALIEVIEPFVTSDVVKPISLPAQDQSTPTGATATVIGWGDTSYGGVLSDNLMKVDVAIVDQDTCVSVYGSIAFDIYPDQICAESPQGGVGTCNGDSGGPLIVDDTLVGITSWGVRCVTDGYPAVYTRVASHRDWITQHTGI